MYFIMDGWMVKLGLHCLKVSRGKRLKVVEKILLEVDWLPFPIQIVTIFTYDACISFHIQCMVILFLLIMITFVLVTTTSFMQWVTTTVVHTGTTYLHAMFTSVHMITTFFHIMSIFCVYFCMQSLQCLPTSSSNHILYAVSTSSHLATIFFEFFSYQSLKSCMFWYQSPK